MQLSSSWKRQHSAENLIEAVENEGARPRMPSSKAYERLYNGGSRHGDEEEEEEDDDGSSTEVEGGEGCR
jgi:hypothetical protein